MFGVIQDDSTQPRASIALWSVLESGGGGVLSNSVTVWWLGMGQHKGKEIFEKKLRVLFGDKE